MYRVLDSTAWSRRGQLAIGLGILLHIAGQPLVSAAPESESTPATLPSGEPVSSLDDPTLYSLPKPGEPDPLAGVAESIRQVIDPTMDPGWPGDYNPDYVKEIEAGKPQYARFWERIVADGRRYVDLDGDGTPEFFTISQGLNSQAWGYRNFLCVMEKPWDEQGIPAKNWRMAHFVSFDTMELSYSGNRLAECAITVCDLDRDGRPDILVTHIRAGGSGCTYTLRVLTMTRALEVREHVLTSAQPITVLEGTALRPVFTQHLWSEGRPGDCGAAQRQRGYRRFYYHWTGETGFVRF